VLELELPPMFGQLAGVVDGVVVLVDGVVAVVVVVSVELPVAAFVIAAPPPAMAPTTAMVIRIFFGVCMVCVPPFWCSSLNPVDRRLM
jgi:hypothetical protein